VAAFWAGLGRLWDTRTRAVLGAIPSHHLHWCEDLAFTADGKTLVTGGHDMNARFWSLDDRPNYNLTPSSPAILHPAQVVKVSLTSDGRHLATALWDGAVYLWRCPEGPPVAYSIPAGGATVPALSPDSQFVLPRGTSCRNGTQQGTRVYEAKTGKAAGPNLASGGILVDASFSPDGTQVATASLAAHTPAQRNERLFEPDGRAGHVQIWDWKTGERLAGPVPTPGEPRGLAFQPKGRTLAVVCADCRVLLINPQAGAIIHHLDPGVCTRPLNADLWWSSGEARFSPDGRFLVTWEMGVLVHVWDADKGQLLHKLTHNGRVELVSFNPAAPGQLATGGRNNAVRIWDLESGNLLARLQHPKWAVGRFSPDGAELISCCDDRMIRIWDWRKGKLKGKLKEAFPHPAKLIDFTADRRWLVGVELDEVQVTDWRTKTPVGPQWKLKGGANLGLCIPAGNRRAIAGGLSGCLVGYDLEALVTPTTGPTEDLVQLAELVSGRRILTNGNVVSLSSSEWAERWRARCGARVAP
jgi:WD40 repeat protein